MNDPPAPAESLHLPQQGAKIANDTNLFCRRCGHEGCDVRVQDCSCTLHARCCTVTLDKMKAVCLACGEPVKALQLWPMSFVELDEATAEASVATLSDKRGKKRKNATIARLNPEYEESTGLRTGRWTSEETAYCDQLIQLFDWGLLPIEAGMKLNDFLARMFKSKQSRLTKKMKNAKLSMRSYVPVTGYVVDDAVAQEVSRLEQQFFTSIPCRMERAEIRFHMQKEWRELFSSYCFSMKQRLDADEWLSSVEELERRDRHAKDAARLAKRRVMMGQALSQDSSNPQNGVFIDVDHTKLPISATRDLEASMVASLDGSMRSGKSSQQQHQHQRHHNAARSRGPFTKSPFLARVIHYMQRHGIPFEHVDAWVPSYVPANGEGVSIDPQYRLCFAGYATADTQVIMSDDSGVGQVRPLAPDEYFDFLSFGEYSQKFSFDIGCGLPGRCYASGRPSWEQGIHNAPTKQFERCGGAQQWGIQTVLGVPIPSPNVGRMVVIFYSRHDRSRDEQTVQRICDYLGKLMPSPQWKLVVEIGEGPMTVAGLNVGVNARERLSALVRTHMPESKASPLALYLPGFTALRLLLSKRAASDRESAMITAAEESFTRYMAAGHSERDIAWMAARDHMLLTKHRFDARSASGARADLTDARIEVNPNPLDTSFPFEVPHDPLEDNSLFSRTSNGFPNVSALACFGEIFATRMETRGHHASAVNAELALLDLSGSSSLVTRTDGGVNT